MAIFCDFHDIDNEILGQIIQGYTSSIMCRKALKDNLTLKQVLDEAPRLELSESRAAIIENTAAANVSNDASAHTVNSGHRGHRGQHYRSRGSSNYDGRHFNNGSQHNTCVHWSQLHMVLATGVTIIKEVIPAVVVIPIVFLM